MVKKKSAFTLIELVALLVIMAIIALIVTPLVMSIIRKAKVSADKRSVDAYGRSIELAIAGYLMDTGSFPTEVSQLTIEYSGDEVVCLTTQLNSDSSIYLAGCTVGGRSVDGYTYGKEESVPTPTYTAYSVGDEVTYNNVDYYVIKDSSTSEETVTLLKAEPLTVAEVNQYGGVGTANNHVNMYAIQDISSSYYQTASNQNGYGGMAYYTSETCGYVNNNLVESGCTTDYAQSEVKYVVDAWKAAQAPSTTEARLITIDEVLSLGYEWKQTCPTCSENWVRTNEVPIWLNLAKWYWTISPHNDSSSTVWSVEESDSSNIGGSYVDGGGSGGVVRPVIVLPKSALSA